MKYKISLIILSIVFLSPLFASAQLSKPFGGKSTFVTACTCDGTFLITVLDAASMGAPVNFIYSPITTTLLGYMLIMTPGVNVLGLANPMMSQCMIANPGNGCSPSGFGYPITLVGTSL